jgi:hypothetical protein
MECFAHDDSARCTSGGKRISVGRSWPRYAPPLIKLDEAVRKSVDALSEKACITLIQFLRRFC